MQNVIIIFTFKCKYKALEGRNPQNQAKSKLPSVSQTVPTVNNITSYHNITRSKVELYLESVLGQTELSAYQLAVSVWIYVKNCLLPIEVY